MEYEDPNESTQQSTIAMTEGRSSTLEATQHLATTQVTTTENIAKQPESTPYDPNGEKKDKIPVVIGMEEKVSVKKGHNSDATVVRDV